MEEAERGRQYKRDAINLQFQGKIGEAAEGEALAKAVQAAYTAAASCLREALNVCGRDEEILLLLELAEIYREDCMDNPRRALYYVCLSYSLAKQRKLEEGKKSDSLFYENLICALCEECEKTLEDPEVTAWKYHYQYKP